MAKITMEGGGAGGSITGSGAAGQVAFFTGTDSIDSDALLLYDDVSDVLTVGAATDGAARLNVQGFGAGASTTGKALSVKDDNGFEVFAIGDNGRIITQPTTTLEAASNNVVIGTSDTGAALASGARNIIIGDEAGEALSSGSDNVLVGVSAGNAVTSGNYNTAIGPNSARSISTGYNNTCVGRNAGDNITSGFDNVCAGREAGNGTTNGSYNISLGFQAGKFRVSGPSGSTNTSSTNSIFIGVNTQSFNQNDDNCIVIGKDATSAGSNTCTLGADTITNTYLKGDINLVDGADIIIGVGSAGTKIGTSTTQKLALWNKTPIAQPTTAISGATITSPGAGNVIKTDDTFGGYTLAQVVQALINVGILQ